MKPGFLFRMDSAGEPGDGDRAGRGKGVTQPRVKRDRTCPERRFI